MTKYSILFVSLFSVALNASVDLPKQPGTHNSVSTHMKQEIIIAGILGAVACAGTKLQSTARSYQRLSLAAKICSIVAVATTGLTLAFMYKKLSQRR